MYKLNNDFIIRKDENEAIAFHTLTGLVYLLNEVAAYILDIIVETDKLDDIHLLQKIVYKKLSEEYSISEINETKIYTDINNVIHDMLHKNLIVMR